MIVKLQAEHYLEFLSLKGQACLSLLLSKCHIVGNHMSRLIFVFPSLLFVVVQANRLQTLGTVVIVVIDVYLHCLVKHSFKSLSYMGLVARKPVFGISDKARLKPVTSATETS